MVASAQYARIVTTTVLRSSVDSSFAIVSDDLPGLFLAGDDLSVLMADVPAAIKKLYLLDCGEELDVTPVEGSASPDDGRWVELPKKFVAIPACAH